MKTSISIALALAITATAACGQQEDVGAQNDAGAMMGDSAMSMGEGMQGSMPMKDGMGDGSETAKTARGTGVVTAVDPEAGTITIDHGPLPEAGWPAMEMGFAAPAALARSVKVGDQVAFELALKDGAGEVTAISKR